MSFFGVKSGTYWLTSKTDPRWCVSEHVEHMSVVTDWFARKVKELTDELGPPPDDLTCGGMKD
jgi:hypothetical protein